MAYFSTDRVLRGVLDLNAIAGVAEILRTVDVRADDVSLHQIIVRRGVEEMNAGTAIRRNDIAKIGRRAADRVGRCVLDENPVTLICQRGATRYIRADEVSLNRVTRRAVVQVHAL